MREHWRQHPARDPLVAGITWSGNTPEEIIGKIEGIQKELVVQVDLIVSDVVYEASLEQADILEKAVTPTGERRVASGAGEFPGRHVTGNMINQIENSVISTGDSVTGTWGWTNPEGYILQQEYSDMYGAHSIAQSMIAAKEKLKGRIAQLLKGGV